ncbi:GIY-YIG nuclease superfamily protein [Vibrio phage 1.031.O._10N.261.46.F8]|nr:GIY-YIG nuclease superfamily protein [Vibrio phage 1.031.O._10N.261.46.F8]
MAKVEVRNYIVYFVRCKTGALYCGITNNPWRRWYQHLEGKGAKSVRMMGGPIEMRIIDEHLSKSDALKIEFRKKQLKKSDKEELWDTAFLLRTAHGDEAKVEDLCQ